MGLKTSFRFVRYSEGMLEDFIWLFRESFHKEVTKDFFVRKMDTGYLGVSKIGIMAYDNENRPASFYAVYPYELFYQGSYILGAQSGDLMTHPRHRKKGLFYEVADKTHALAKELGIRYVYSLPAKNTYSYHGFMKRGFVDISKIKLYYDRNKGSFYPRLLNKLGKWTYDKYIRREIDKKNVEVMPEFLEKYEDAFCLSRKESFFHYKKYFNSEILEFEHGHVWLKVNTGDHYNIEVGDFLPKRNANSIHLWNNIIKFAEILNIEFVFFRASEKASVSERFENAKIPFKEVGHVVVLDLGGLKPVTPLAIKGADEDIFGIDISRV